MRTRQCELDVNLFRTNSLLKKRDQQKIKGDKNLVGYSDD